MAQNNVNVPSGFGGLLRFNEEYDSKIQLKPGHVIAFAAAIVLLVLALKAFFPVA
jgi:preprotein translocase subunit Sec61beta